MEGKGREREKRVVVSVGSRYPLPIFEKIIKILKSTIVIPS
jgi:hypothetical protein